MILAAVAWPSLDRSLEAHRLRKAGDMVRTQWCRARVQAMRGGATYAFRYLPGQDRYTLEGYRGPEYVADTEEQDARSEALLPGEHSDKRLPEGVIFGIGQTDPDTRAAGVTIGADASESSEDGWSPPIYFYPDGSTSTARLTLASERGYHLELALRGLTGIVTVRQIEDVQERQP